MQIASRLRCHVLLFCLLLGCGMPRPAVADHAASKLELGPWTQGLQVGPGMDASGRNLRGCKFIGLDLRNARFDGVDLGGAELYQCDLRNASFKSAVLTGLLWGDCKLEGADLSDAVLNGITPIHGVSGYGIKLTSAQFASTRSYKAKSLGDCIVALTSSSRTDLITPRLDFRGADLQKCIFVFVNLTQCDFTDATITGMGVNGGAISFAQIASTRNFRRGNLYDVGLGGVVPIGKWDLSGIDMRGARFVGSGLLRNVDLTDTTINDCKFRCSISKDQLFVTRSCTNREFLGVQIWNVDFSDADFSGMNLTGCHFCDCDFTNASFEDTVVSDVRFERKGITLDQIKSTWNYKHGSMTSVVLPKEIMKALESDRAAAKEKPQDAQ